MMTAFLLTLMMGGAQPAFAQQQQQQQQQPQQKLSDDKPIIVTGIANGARIVEVDFDKVWKKCAECKRALAKLDRLAGPVRDEQSTARLFIARPAPPPGSPSPSVGVTTFTRSSAQNPADLQGTNGPSDTKVRLDGERQGQQDRAHFAELNRRFIRPEQLTLVGHMRSFLDQLAPHIAAATEAERVAHGARAGLTDKKRTKLVAKNLTRIDVTDAVIRRLDAMDFEIKLPEPVPSPARR